MIEIEFYQIQDGLGDWSFTKTRSRVIREIYKSLDRLNRGIKVN